MPDGSNEGLNIATRPGDGDAYIMHWENTNKVLNELHQRDMYQQKAISDDYRKSQLQIQAAGSKLRAADLPKSQAIYKAFEQAGRDLLVPQIRQNPQLYAEAKSRQDNALVDYLNLTEHSKDATKMRGDLGEDRLKSNGVNRIGQEEYLQKMKEFDETPTDELAARGLNNYATYMTTVDDTDKDFKKNLFERKVFPESTPHYDAKGKLDYNDEIMYSVSTKPVGEISHGGYDNLLKSKTADANAKTEFDAVNKTDASKIDQTIAAAYDLAKKEPYSEFANFPRTPEGYAVARLVIEAKTKVYEGQKTRKYDELYKQDRQFEQAKRLQEDRQAFEFKETTRRIAAQKELKKTGAAATGTVTVPDASYFEAGLAHPGNMLNGKTNLEHVNNALNVQNSVTTGVNGGRQLQVLPGMTNDETAKNGWYKGAVDQTLEQLKIAMEQAQTGHNYEHLKIYLHNKNVSTKAKLTRLAEVYNELNAINKVSSRFTAEDLEQNVPLLMKDVKGATNQSAESIKYGVLKPGTPEFRDVIENARQKLIAKQKKFSMAEAIGHVDDETSDNDGYDVKPM